MEINRIYRHAFHAFVGKVLLEEYFKTMKTLHLLQGLKVKNSTFCPQIVFMCSVCI
jgi:hypothetical protein